MTSKRSSTDVYNLPKLKGLRRALRRNLTPAEAALWNILKNGQLDGRKFRRQHSIGDFIFDFYCPSENLAIELDGQRHLSGSPKAKDRSKRLFAESQGIRVIRFENKRVFEDPDWVVEVIKSNFGWSLVIRAKPGMRRP